MSCFGFFFWGGGGIGFFICLGFLHQDLKKTRQKVPNYDVFSKYITHKWTCEGRMGAGWGGGRHNLGIWSLIDGGCCREPGIDVVLYTLDLMQKLGRLGKNMTTALCNILKVICIVLLQPLT